VLLLGADSSFISETVVFIMDVGGSTTGSNSREGGEVVTSLEVDSCGYC
jgi:hypothetical protein